ncbi:DUF3667 domain-containing protein [Stenotrophomonas sp. 24(2023)]|uniref:DUF3667 domain-containing protein n=1 Tax=Stenotrophomonas sp. 24(2023) TaxID=3068324 RepID=UPI0027E06021|nr:DUF3667 domain-containing protein [Stenotrophomonas sp. 24(2023)]WMJ68050.1 DUF3667 domain-containing protein [Stenotrophomonas sp. 24(2023)]
MSSTDTVHAAVPDATAPAHGACENCQTMLHGHYCHSCGQSAHNPLKHVGHAIEEVFESFWHLDGRIFRTLRDLLVPGRVARNYLNGNRVGYVQPLRLFVVLTLFTFFVGKLTLHADDFSLNGGDNSLFTKAQTVEEVEAIRSAQVAAFEQQQRTSPSGAAAFAMAMAAVNTAAAQRSKELSGGELPAQDASQHGTFFDYSVNGTPWNADSNPVVVTGAPQFVNNWLNHRLQNGNANLERMGNKTDLYVQAILTALPGALFFLMPVFALVLRVAYVSRSTGYLEHLVVALYSHAWLMLVLLLTFLLVGLDAAMASPALHATSRWLYALLWLAVPAYLLWMQQRVYAGNKLLTLLRYLLIGSVYTLLVSLAVLYAVLAGVSA